MDATTTAIFALEAHTSTRAQSITDADGTSNTISSLAEFVTAQSRNEFCQNAVRHLGQSETEFTLNKEGVLVRHVSTNRV